MSGESCFKAYDIRGKVPDQLNERLAYHIGHAYAATVQPMGPVAIGFDVRESSPRLAAALTRGLNEAGVDTRQLGLCGTETVYFAAAQPDMGGGVMITASHNPIEYNGLKLVREDARPISGDSGLRDIEKLALAGYQQAAAHPGQDEPLDVMDDYVQKVLSFVDVGRLKPLHLVVNAGNGCAGPAFDAIAQYLPFKITRIHHEPDGTFPHGIPNPLLPENREVTAQAVREAGADMGIAWDGDFDRCFFFDERGEFIEGYYLVGLLAVQMLKKYPGSKIIHDPRLTWNTIEMVTEAGGIPVQSKTGHAFIKERMRKEDAVYGGEMSAHHYFRDFAYCDSGMIPWLLIVEQLSDTGQAFSRLVEERVRAYPCSGEINYRVADVGATVERVLESYAASDLAIDRTDGVSAEFSNWRFNIRGSNTEPMLRLNVEARGDRQLVSKRLQELSKLIVGAA